MVLTFQDATGYGRLNYTKVAGTFPNAHHVQRMSNLMGYLFSASECNGLSKIINTDSVLIPPNSTCDIDNSMACILDQCGTASKVNLFVINSEQERLLGIGRAWPYPTLQKQEVLLHATVARTLDIVSGDIVVLSLDAMSSFSANLQFALNSTNPSPSIFVHVPLVVAGIFDTPMGKYPTSTENVIVMEWDLILGTIADRLPSSYSTNTRKRLSSFDSQMILLQTSTDVLFACSANRVDCYMNSDYSAIAIGIIEWGSSIIYQLGFSQTRASLGVLLQLNRYQFFAAFLGLLFTIVTLLMAAISVLLIYSLLLVAVETKTFELGIFRMVGLQKSGLILMIVVRIWNN